MQIKFNSPKSTVILLRKMLKLIGENPVIPIVENFLIESQEDKTANIGATDLTNFGKAPLLNVQTDGQKWSVGVYGEMFKNALSQFDDSKGVVCNFSFSQKTGWMCKMEGFLNGEPLFYNFACENGSDFPSFPKIERKDLHSKVKGKDLTTALNSVAFCCLKDELRPALTGVFFDSQNAKFLTLVATNGHILSEHIVGRTNGKTESFIMPSKMASVLDDLIDNQSVEIYSNKDNSSFKFDGIELMCQNIDARYPDYKAVIPVDYCEILSFSQKDMVKQLGIVKTDLTDRNKIKKSKLSNVLWKIDKNKAVFYPAIDTKQMGKNTEIEIYGNSAVANIDVKWNESPINIGFDVNYTLSLLKKLDGKSDTIEFQISNATKGVLVKKSGNTKNQGLIMPRSYEGLEKFTCGHELSPIAPIRTEPLPDDDEVEVLPTPSVKMESAPLFEAEPSYTNFYAKLTDEQIIESETYGSDTSKLLKTCDPFKKDERVTVSLHGLDKDVLDKYNGKEARVFACVQKKWQKVYKVYLVRFDDGFYHASRLEDLEKVTPSVSNNDKYKSVEVVEVAKGVRMSKDYWDKCTEIEKSYILERATIAALPDIKMIISDARKTGFEITNLYGKGFIQTKDGNTYLYSGNATREFKLLEKATPSVQTNLEPILPSFDVLRQQLKEIAQPYEIEFFDGLFELKDRRKGGLWKGRYSKSHGVQNTFPKRIIDFIEANDIERQYNDFNKTIMERVAKLDAEEKERRYNVRGRGDKIVADLPPSVKTQNFDIEAEKIRITAEARKRRIRILNLKNA